jgi:Tfp pilus assembly protein PilX
MIPGVPFTSDTKDARVQLYMNRRTYRGQTVLITVLVLTIALTVALSLIRRTTVDVKTTGQLEESSRAFSAAEAGIEDALKRAGPQANVQIGSATFDTTYTDIAGTSAVYTYPTGTEQGDVATIWLVPHGAGNSLDTLSDSGYCTVGEECIIDVCWEQPASPADIPAVEIAVLYTDAAGTAYNIQRFPYDPKTERIGNKFSRANALGSGCGGISDVYAVSVTLPTDNARPLMLRLRPYYNKTTFTVSPSSGRTLPSQGFEVTSTGKTESGVTRKIVVKKMYDAPASIFDFVLYANTTITNEAYPL